MTHGGDIYRNKVTIDFSVSINPLGMPESVEEALKRAILLSTCYPDPFAEQLRYALSGWLSVPESYLMFGNGASELLLSVMHGLKPKKCIIPVPSFYGYEYAAEALQGEVLYYPMKQEDKFCLQGNIFSVLQEDVDMLVLANPNNPVGNLLEPEFLEEILAFCNEREIYVVLDECFIPFCESGYSMLPKVEQYKNLLVVRAFTKIFSIPGVRLGYLVSSNKTLLDKVKHHIPEWNLSVFAQAAGAACCREQAFVEKTVDFLKEEGRFLAEKLREAGLTVFPHKANFIMVYTECPLYEKLLERGILIRDCSNFRGLSKGYYRIAVKSREENQRLLKEIGEIL